MVEYRNDDHSIHGVKYEPLMPRAYTSKSVWVNGSTSDISFVSVVDGVLVWIVLSFCFPSLELHPCLSLKAASKKMTDDPGTGKIPPPAAALARSWFQWSAAEPDLVSVGIAVRDLAHTVRVGFPLHRIESPIGSLRDEVIEVIDEARVHGVAGVLQPLHNIHVPMRSQLPHGLCVVWEEGGL